MARGEASDVWSLKQINGEQNIPIGANRKPLETEVAISVVADSGLLSLYRGLTAPLIGSMAECASLFVAYGAVKRALHIDPDFAQMSGFDKPILHGLCSLGYAVRAVLGKYGGSSFRAVRVRFSGSVSPGETLATKMWLLDERRVAFVTEVEERPGAVAINNAFVEFESPVKLASKL